MKMWVTCCLRGILILLLTTSAAWAQATAQMSGTVRDASGAVLPGVTVTVTQVDTSVTRTAVTDESGAYLLPNLPTGPYRLEASLQGFRSYAQTGIVLQVGATPSINIVLAIGNVEETVSVEGAAPIVDVKSSGISNVVQNEQILQLPLNGRNAAELVLTVGAAVQTGTPARGVPGGLQISVAGGLPFGVTYTLDGATHNNPQSNTNFPLPFPDALQEFRVATSGLAAENGMHSGAAVSAVTKSGTNQFNGTMFEFLRDHRFNATSPFAAIGPDGKRQDDGLKRNQFGGTLGGPILRDKLFFFGAYQGTIRRQLPADNIQFIPTPQMVAGDFTAFASPACNGGRQLTLGGPFAGNNNRINPALFSPAALAIVKRLPATTDPCGQTTYASTQNQDDHQPVARIDFQLTPGQLIFGRYLGTRITIPPGYGGSGSNILTSNTAGSYNLLHSASVGDSMVLSSTLVNSVRATINWTHVKRYQNPLFQPSDVGIKLYSYPPGAQFPLTVNQAFSLQSGQATKREEFNTVYAFSDDLTLVKGSHQFGFGGILQFWHGNFTSSSRTGGNWIVDGHVTGSPLADFMIGRIASVEHGGPNILNIKNWYTGWYGQDSWRAGSRVTVNGGLRWEPYFGQHVVNNAVTIFVMDNFLKGVHSTVFHNAPAGLIYPGDPGFPKGNTGLNTQWTNFSPRAGVAWDVHGDGRLAVRSSYSMGYDFMPGEYHNINAGAPPFGNRSIVTDPPGGLDDPYGGNDPHPIVTGPDTQYIAFGAFGSMDPDINSPRVQQWNATVEQQLGSNWGVSVSYLGSYSDRLWAQTALNPGIYMGMGPCTIQGVSYTTCTTNANLNQRRKLYQINPVEAAKIGALDLNSDVGFQKYKGLKLAAQRRSATLMVSGSYTLSRCFGTTTTTAFNQTSAGYTNPDDPAFDAGPCDQDRTHLGSLTMGYETPQVGSGVLGAIASRWRVTGILNARSGNRLNISSGVDQAFNGINGSNVQRPDKVSDDFYASPRTLNTYFNRAAFARPAAGMLGNLQRNALVGPAFWVVDMGLLRSVQLGTRRIELRLESFNVLNHFNWGDPATNFNSGQFGRITTQAGEPRVMQFGIKYEF